jgi:hypothetical protein
MTQRKDTYMRIIVTLLAVSLVGLVACARGQAMPVRGPDGSAWYAIECSHGAKNCWGTAAAVCPAGYEIADSHEVTGGGFLFFGHHQRGDMLIRCSM